MELDRARQQLEKEIKEAYLFLREKNQTVPSETLDFILVASLEKLRDSNPVLEEVKKIPQQGQVQYDLTRQLAELRIAANKLGLYDAADFLKPKGE